MLEKLSKEFIYTRVYVRGNLSHFGPELRVNEEINLTKSDQNSIPFSRATDQKLENFETHTDGYV